MKRLDEMTEAELLALTPENVSRLIDSECAFEGIELAPIGEIPQAPQAPKILPDMTLYEVAGVFCEDPAHAARVLAVLTEGTLYKRDGYNEDAAHVVMVPGDYSYPKIESKPVFSPALLAERKEELAAYKAAKAAWEKDTAEVRRIRGGQETIAERVRQHIGDARQRENYRQRVRADFDRFLDLAEGNRAIAWRFLAASPAHADLSEVEPELAAELREAV